VRIVISVDIGNQETLLSNKRAPQLEFNLTKREVSGASRKRMARFKQKKKAAELWRALDITVLVSTGPYIT
jgi:hypothetical protein